MKLHLGEKLALPVDFVTAACVVYGGRGSGKTTFGTVVAEELYRAGQRFCAIDLKGDYWGFKSSADGKSEGLPVLIFGGDHADLPLEENAGEFLGGVVAELEQPCVLDLEHLSKGKQIRFLGSFLTALYHKNRAPLMLIMDEAHRYAPQKPMNPEHAICLGASEDIVRLGRKHGLGAIIVAQRGAGLNKEVSELCEVLIAFRTPGPIDQERIRSWLGANATREQGQQVEEMIDGLAHMPTGTAVIASANPDLAKILTTAKIRDRETFDSSATPRVGQRKREPKILAKPELEAIKTKMADAIARKESEDPKKLRARIAQLELELKKKAPTEQVVKTEIKEIEKPILGEKMVARLEKTITQLTDASNAVSAASNNILTELRKFTERPYISSTTALGYVSSPHAYVDPKRGSDSNPGTKTAPTATVLGAATALMRRNGGSRKVIHLSPGQHHLVKDASLGITNTEIKSEPRLRRGARDMLAALAARHPTMLTRQQIATLAGMSAGSGTFSTYLGELQRAGFISRDHGGDFFMTPVGLDFIGPVASPRTHEELVAMWLPKFRAGAREMLQALIRAYPEGLPRDVLAESAGMSAASGTFSTYLGELVRAGVAEKRGGLIVAGEALYA